MGSSSLSNSSTDLPDGLQFGQKIYFEDVGLGATPKSDAGGSSSSSPTGTKKGKGGAVQGAQPPRCQVEGCRVDLSDAKSYYSRHKVCGMHSKCPKVIVAGLEQRFCQQCSRQVMKCLLKAFQVSYPPNTGQNQEANILFIALTRFHQLPEFDQEKRSCRRRLAGHNERRRKPQSSSLLTSPYARLASPAFDKRNRVGSFLMEFAAYRKLTLKNELPASRSTEQVNQISTPPWRGNSDTPELSSRGSVGWISYPGPRNPPSESFAGITDATCALSLLSNQTWGPRNRAPSLGVNNLYFGGTPMTQLAAPCHGAAIPQLTNASRCFDSINAGNCPLEVVPDVGLGQSSQPLNSQVPIELVVPQPNRRLYVDLESRAYESTQHMHWSL